MLGTPAAMATADDQKNIHHMLLQFCTMGSEVRSSFLTQLLSHLTAAEAQIMMAGLAALHGGKPSASGGGEPGSGGGGGGAPGEDGVAVTQVEVTPLTKAPMLIPQTEIKTEPAFNGLALSEPGMEEPPKKRLKPAAKNMKLTKASGLCSVCSGEDRSMHVTTTGNQICRACEAFFMKHVSMEAELECRNDLSCRIIKKRKQAYCNYCRLHKCYASGMVNSADGGTSTPPPRPPLKKKTDESLLMKSEHYEQAAATIQSFLPDIVKQGLTPSLDDTDAVVAAGATAVSAAGGADFSDHLDTVGLGQVQFDCLTQQIPAALVVGGAGQQLGTVAINLSAAAAAGGATIKGSDISGPLRDSDISISFDEEPAKSAAAGT